MRVSNREYKSDVFCMLMEYPEYAADVYKALGGKSEVDPKMIEIKTLEKGISLSIRNDAAFIIDTDLHLYEHQSTYNPNMPLRSLIYLTDILKPMIKDHDLYSRKLIKIPKPKFVIFYNGSEDRPEVEVQRLSEAYSHAGDDEDSIELICTAYNINPDKNDGLKNKSFVLDGYMRFVEKVRENINNSEVENDVAVEKAVGYCIDNHILEEFFITRKDEVIKVMTIDMTFEAREKIFTREAYAEGREDGIKEGYASMIMSFSSLVTDGILTKEEAARRLNMSLVDFDKAIIEANDILNSASLLNK